MALPAHLGIEDRAGTTAYQAWRMGKVGGAEGFGTLKEGIHPRDPLETYCSRLVVSHHAGLSLGSEHQ